MNSKWIEILTPVLIYREELPSMTEEQEKMFCSRFARELGEYFPTGQDWIDLVQETLCHVGITKEEVST